MAKKIITTEVHLELGHLEDREAKMENIVLRADRNSNIVSKDTVDQTIQAFARSENSTLGYAAACFAPVLLLLNALPFLSGLNDFITDIFVAFSIITLGASGMYFALYKAIFLGPRRIAMEGYRIGLINKYRFSLTPRGIWLKINLLAITFVPIGYLAIVALMLRVLFS